MPGEEATRPVLVLAALGEELAGLERNLAEKSWRRTGGGRRLEGRIGRRPVVLVKTGIGPENARRTAEKALDLFPDPPFVLNTGYCGGLDPALDRGTMIVSSECLPLDAEGAKEGIRTDGFLVKKAADLLRLEGIPRAVGRTLTVAEALGSPADKQAAGRRYEALAVDMESSEVAAACRVKGAPLLVCRVIIDTAERALPDFSRFTDRDHRLRPAALFAEILRRPSTLSKLARAAADSFRVGPVLEKTACVLAEGLTRQGR